LEGIEKWGKKEKKIERDRNRLKEGLLNKAVYGWQEGEGALHT
jgi:hypothetical protein